MPVPSEEEILGDMRDWWDKLQSRQTEVKREEIKIDVKQYTFRETDPQSVPTPPPDKVIQ